MKNRLSLDERSEFAFKLRSQILSIENPDLLEALSDGRFQPHRHAVGIYAFEFFLDRHRKGFRSQSVEEQMSYSIGWSKGAMMRDEEAKRPEKIIRMAVTLFMISVEERGEIRTITTSWVERLANKNIAPNAAQLEMFLFEVFYELALELSGELFKCLK